ncbi:RNA polymerase sigma factor [Singulisphaera sp. PoT]|uniref:RNA polymerase sigma factor n=1 Tax=Singulisphaera sp. PoT TaxID=3411797 RepID=UPI003BF58A17
MNEPSDTRQSLLIRIRDTADAVAWRQFVDLYGPLVYRYARRRGLQDADAADLMQDVLSSVVRVAGRYRYEPERGTFRGWLLTVARNKLHTFQSGRKKILGNGTAPEANELAEKVVAAEDEAAWDREYEWQVFSWAAEQVRGEFTASTWQAFWKTAVEGLAAGEAAKVVGLSVGAVYVAKSRVLARIREQIQDLSLDGLFEK